MKSNAGRVLLGIAVVAVAVVLFVVLKDDGGDDGGGSATTTSQSKSTPTNKPSKPAIPTIVVRNGAPVGGVETLSFDEGERIRFKVISDTSDEIHIHGYDIEQEVEAGGSVSFDFPAAIEGIFEVELHESGEQIAEIQVNP